MKWHLVLYATENERFQDAVRNVIRQVRPSPTIVTIIDPRKHAGSEETIASNVFSFEEATGVFFVDGPRRRRSTPNDARALAWSAIATSPLPNVLYMEDRFRFTRAIDLRDVAHVLERETYLGQMAFTSARSKEPAGDLMGSGAIRWRLREAYFSLAPSLIRPWVARSFPWPGSVDELETGLRASLPNVRFASWGMGDAWVVEA